MITKIKKVYYCEYCKKRSFHKPRMIKHEQHCTLNPNRECGLCDEGGKPLFDIIEKYKKTFKLVEEEIKPNEFIGEGTEIKVKWLKKITLKDIREDVDYCPLCTFTVLRCTGMIHYPVRSEKCLNLNEDFDLKKEIQEWYHEHYNPYYDCYD